MFELFEEIYKWNSMYLVIIFQKYAMLCYAMQFPSFFHINGKLHNLFETRVFVQLFLGTVVCAIYKTEGRVEFLYLRMCALRASIPSPIRVWRVSRSVLSAFLYPNLSSPVFRGFIPFSFTKWSRPITNDLSPVGSQTLITADGETLLLSNLTGETT